ncbi:hypothetical protein PT274_02895 [Leuconostocaceae bacterium ESL0958]|nr:hypothetical protein [Leuconostocaceae bacterium ESL0958]
MSNTKKPSKAGKIVLACSFALLVLVGLGSLFDGSDSSKKTESKTTKVQKETASELTNWLKNSYPNEARADFEKSGQQYDGSRDQLMTTCISGFKESSGDLYVTISQNQLKAEGLTQKEVANYAFNVIYTSYRGDTGKAKFKNLKDDGSLDDKVMLDPKYYSEFTQ